MHLKALCYSRYVSRRVMTKTLLIMKLTAILLFVACLQVSARGYSQVTLSEKNVSLQKVFKQIQKQTGFDFLYTYELVQDAGKISIDVHNVSLQQALEECLKAKPLTYSIVENTIVIKPKIMLAIQGALPATDPPPITISGRITDEKGMPLSGVSVLVKGSSKGTQTNGNGEYTLTDVNDNAVLVFSYVGFESYETPVAKRRTITLQMKMVESKLEEFAVTINTGYQTVSKERATGAYSVITAARMDNKLKPDLKAAMEGQAAGMVLTKEGNLEIRGVSTFLPLTDRAPLIVVDGFPISGGLETINVDNVETITILKDAVAASIYGSRSSNGVIVVTTKQARRGAMRVDYKGSTGMVLKPNLDYLNRVNSADYVDAEIELYNQNPNGALNTYNAYGYLSKVNYLMVAKAQGVLTAADVDNQIAQLKTNDGIGQLQKYLFRNQLTQQHNISLSSGSEKSSLYAAAKYITNRGNMLYTNDDRVIVDLKNEWKPSKNVSVRVLSNINYNTSDAPLRTSTELLTYASGSLLHPYDLVVDPATGEPQEIYATNPRKTTRYAAIPGLKTLNYNPLTDLGLEMTRIQNLQLRVGGSVNVVILNGLSAEAGGTWTRGNNFSKTISDKSSYRLRLAYDDATSISNSTKHYIPDGAMVNEIRSVNTAYTFRGQLNFNRTFNKHSVIAIAGEEVSRDIFDNNTYPTRFGYNDQAGTFSTFNYSDYNAGLYNADMLGTNRPTASLGSFSFRDNRFVSSYANGSYEYDRRFIVSGSIRLDQTNFFGTDPKFRYKPLWSAGGTYKISNEKFFDVPWISKMHIRGSYGLNGNISLGTGPFLIITAGSFSAQTGDISYGISSPPNNSLRWEKTITTNLGTDMSFFKSRLNMTLDYYLRNSKDLISADAIDPTLGFTSLQKNVGQIKNTGIELTLEGNIIQKNKFTWNGFATISYNSNKVVTFNTIYLYPTSVTVGTVPPSGGINIKGYPSNALFSYRYAGLDNNGSALYYNTKGEKVGGGVTTVNDPVYTGTLRPKFVYSLTNTFRYGSFDMSFMFIAKTGNVLRKDSFTGGNYQNENVVYRWKNAGDEKTTIYPKLSTSTSDVFYFPFADIFVESASYVKLRDLSLTYSFNRNLLKRVGIQNAKVYFQGRNLWMWAANSDKIDPETAEVNLGGAIGSSLEQGYTSLPLRPEFYVGLSFNF